MTRASALKSAFLPSDRNEAKNARQLLLFQTRKTAKVFISCLVFLALLNEKEFANTENEEQDTSLREALHSSTDFVKRTTVEDVKMSRNLPYFGKLQL